MVLYPPLNVKMGGKVGPFCRNGPLRVPSACNSQVPLGKRDLRLTFTHSALLD